MRKGTCFIPLGLLIMVLCIMSTVSPAFASTRQATASSAALTNATMAQPAKHRPRSSGWNENNQDSHVVATNVANKHYVGHDNGNSGNHGYNRGYVEDNSGNGAGQINNEGAIRPSRNNQRLHEVASNAYNIYARGVRQVNSGNSGHNDGSVRDNSSNIGNQIIN